MRTTRPNRGFTLLELLVVLVVVAIGTALVSARLMPDDQRMLDQDAERLAQVLSIAQEYSSVRAETLVFLPQRDGFRFATASAGNSLQPVRDDLLAPRRWQLGDTALRIETDGLAVDRLIISPEPGLNRTLIELRNRQARSVIARRYSGRFQVVGR